MKEAMWVFNGLGYLSLIAAAIFFVAYLELLSSLNTRARRLVHR
jgi:hypothetical protein